MRLVQLRTPLSVDHSILVEWRNASREFFFDNRIISYESHMEWWKGVKQNPNQFFWVIQTPSAPVGTISLKIDPIHHHGEVLSLMIAPEYRGQGWGRAGWQQLLKFGFETLGLNRIFCDILADNESSINLATSLKFQVEGVFKQHILRGATYLDVVRFGMLRHGFETR